MQNRQQFAFRWLFLCAVMLSCVGTVPLFGQFGDQQYSSDPAYDRLLRETFGDRRSSPGYDDGGTGNSGGATGGGTTTERGGVSVNANGVLSRFSVLDTGNLQVSKWGYFLTTVQCVPSGKIPEISTDSVSNQFCLFSPF